MKICVVVGNPSDGSRTLRLAHRLAQLLAEDADEVVTIDLADYAREVFAWPSARMDALGDEVAACDLLIAASPTYKATYTGLLKGFLDRFPHLGLRDVAAIPFMTGAGSGHSMAPDVSLRPLLVELGALTPTRGLYFETPRIADAEEILGAWVAENRLALRAVRVAAES